MAGFLVSVSSEVVRHDRCFLSLSLSFRVYRLPNKAILSFPVVFFMKYDFISFPAYTALYKRTSYFRGLWNKGFFIEVYSLILEIKSAYIS